MQEHHKKPTRRLIGSVDGMIAGPSHQGAVKSASPQLGHKPNVMQDQFVRRPRLDDFKRADGFHPAKQPKLEAAVSAAAPAVVSPLSRPLERQPRRRPDGTIDLSLPEGAAKPKKSRFRLRRPTKRGVMISGIVLLLGLGAFFGNGW